MTRLDKYSTRPYKAYLREQAKRDVSNDEFLSEVFGKTQEAMALPAPRLQYGTMDANQQAMMPTAKQGSMLTKMGPITQQFGNINPAIERFSGGFNAGTDIGVGEGTPIALPPGRWQVMEAFNEAKGKGYIGDATNRGYGNSVLARNLDTGEQLRFSHLSGVGVAPGQYDGGTVIGASGATGNATGPHLDLEYYDQAGKLADVLRSAYARYLGVSGEGEGGAGGGNPLQAASEALIYDPKKQRPFPNSPLWAVSEAKTTQEMMDASMPMVMGLSAPIPDNRAKFIGDVYNRYTKSPNLGADIAVKYGDDIDRLYRNFLDAGMKETKQTPFVDKLKTLFRAAADDFRNRTAQTY